MSKPPRKPAAPPEASPARSRADAILSEINPQRKREGLTSCPKCGSLKFTRGGPVGGPVLFRCLECRLEFPLGGAMAIPTKERQKAPVMRAPVSGPYFGESLPDPDRGAPSFRGRGRTYTFEED